MNLRSPLETEAALKTHLNLDNLAGGNTGLGLTMSPFVALTGITPIGDKPLYAFGVFVPIKTLDADATKAYPIINDILNGLLDPHDDFEMRLNKVEIQPYDNGAALMYAVIIDVKQI